MKEEMDRRWHDLGEFIREQRNVGQLSLRKLSEMAGVSNPYLSQIERGLRRPSAEILQQIARALEISSETLYVRAGILEEPGTDIDPVAEIRRDPRLTEEQKKTLVRIYESFCKENEIDRGTPAPTAGPTGPGTSGADAGGQDPDDVGPAGAVTADAGTNGVAAGHDNGRAGADR